MRRRRHFNTPSALDPHEVLIGFMQSFDARLRDVEAKLSMDGRTAELESVQTYLTTEVAEALMFEDPHAFRQWLTRLKKRGLFTVPPRYWYEPVTRHRRRIFTVEEIRQLRAVRFRTKRRYETPMARVVEFAEEMEAKDFARRMAAMKDFGRENTRRPLHPRERAAQDAAEQENES